MRQWGTMSLCVLTCLHFGVMSYLFLYLGYTCLTLIQHKHPRLYALEEVLEEGGEVALQVRDPVFKDTRPKKIMTSSVPWQDSLQEAGFVAPDPEHPWVHYEVGEDG